VRYCLESLCGINVDLVQHTVAIVLDSYQISLLNQIRNSYIIFVYCMYSYTPLQTINNNRNMIVFVARIV